jgi:hypothetical protein
MHVKILDITEDEYGLYVDYQCECGPDGDVSNRKVGPFDGDDPWEGLRIWLAMNAEGEERKRKPRGIPADIAEMIGTPVDTSELRQRYKPQLDQFNERAAQAQQQMEAERKQGVQQDNR